MIKYSHKLEVIMDLNNLSVESQAAFILAIVFTIISIAGAIIYFRRREEAGNVIKILTALVFPFIAIFCWIYMLLNVLANFNIGTSFYSAFLITLALFAIVIAIYYIVVNAEIRKKEREEQKRIEEEEEKAKQEALYLKKLENDVNKLQKKVDENEKAKVEKETKNTTKKATKSTK